MSENDSFIDELIALHYKCRDFLDVRDYEGMVTFMESYKKLDTPHDDIEELIREINELKTILIITRSFKEHELIGPVRKEILNIFENKQEIISLSKKK